jgi:transitional endoplasmic reticulum ATPase
MNSTNLVQALRLRLHSPIWHLIWVVPLLALGPFMRWHGAELAASPAVLQATCMQTPGCAGAKLLPARRSDRSLGSIPSRLFGNAVVVVQGTDAVVQSFATRLTDDGWYRSLLMEVRSSGQFGAGYRSLADTLHQLVVVLMLFGAALWFPVLAVSAMVRSYIYPIGIAVYARRIAIYAVLWQLLAQGFNQEMFVYGGVIPVELLAVNWMALHFLVLSSQKAWSQPRQRARVASPDAPSQPAEIGSPVQPRAARASFADVIGMEGLKVQLKEAGEEILGRRKSQEKVRNGILLHGEPGNGKTFFAEALAGELKLPFMEARINEIGSRWVGQSTEQLVAIFREAQRRAPVVLFLDEVDSILVDRSSITSGDSEASRLVNAMLTETVDLRGRGIVLVAATNFLNRLDSAAIRDGRFDYKIEVPPPDLEARQGLLRRALRRCDVDGDGLARFAARTSGYSIARLTAIAAEASRAFAKDSKRLDYAALLVATRTVQGTRRRLPEGTPGLSDLVLSDSLRQTLEGLAARMHDAERIERLGGSVPTGALFFGPPGTGKTAAVKALAKDTGWVLIPTQGAELAADGKAIDRILAEALDLRPAIVFIDEADAIVGHRLGSGVQSITNAILLAMDRASSSAQDVLFVAATNQPDMVDEAAQRRFTEKVVFDPPGAQERILFAQRWLQTTKANVDPALEAQQIADELDGLTIALCIESMKAAVNCMIARTKASPDGQVTLPDIRLGRRTVAAI